MKKIRYAFFSISVFLAAACISGCGECKHEQWNEADCTTPKTCAECGETEGEPLGHIWIEADCENPKTCEVCGETDDEALGHTWIDADCENPKTCEVCGETEGESLGHKWIDADCENPKTCETCGKKEGKALGHKFDVEPDCTESGVCTICKKEIPAKGHDLSAATCTEPATCKVCGQTDGEPLGHNFKSGYCTRCGEALKVLMYEDESIVVYYTGISEGIINNVEINFYVENKSSMDLTLQIRDESINGSMLECTCSADISAGKNIYDDMSFSYKDLNKIGIYSLDDINVVEFKLHVYNRGNFKLDTAPIKIDIKSSTVSGGTTSSDSTPSSGTSSSTTSLDDVVAYFNEQCKEIENNSNEDVQVSFYGMKSDYYQVTFFVPELEYVYKNDYGTYAAFFSQCQELSKSFKAYFDANGFSDYHVYVGIGAKAPSASSNKSDVTVIDIRDGEVSLDMTKSYYGF